MNRKRVRLGQRRPRVAPYTAFILTSMTDMFTMILVFIMNFVEVNAPPETELALPQSSATEQVEDGVRLTVTSSDVQVNGERVLGLEAGALPAGVVRTGRRIDALYERLSAAGAAQAGKGTTAEQDASNAALVVQCDRGVPFSLLGELLYTAGQAGFGQFRFVVISSPG